MPTQKRKSHNKSRRGCLNCKKRHVKCDEQGLPCAACVVRNTADTCQYERSPTKSPPTSRQHLSPETSFEDDERSTSVTPSKHFECEQQRLLELELILHWSSSTWKSITGVSEDEQYLRIDVPRAGLQCESLHYAIMAVSALDIVMKSTLLSQLEVDRYIRAAVDYRSRASDSLRTALSDMNRKNQHCLYVSSLLLTICNMATPRIAHLSPAWSSMFESSFLDQMGVLFDLFIGTGLIAAVQPDWLLSSPMGNAMRAAQSMISKSGLELRDPSLNSAMARLSSIVTRHTVPLYYASMSFDSASNDTPAVSFSALASSNPSLASIFSDSISPPTFAAPDTSVPSNISPTATSNTSCFPPSHCVLNIDPSLASDSSSYHYHHAVSLLQYCARLLSLPLSSTSPPHTQSHPQTHPQNLTPFPLAFPMFISPAFALSFRRSEPLALFIMMHWAVLVHRLSKRYWWARGVGEGLVGEIAAILLGGGDGREGVWSSQGGWELPFDWVEGVWWAKGEVGLGPVHGMGEPSGVSQGGDMSGVSLSGGGSGGAAITASLTTEMDVEAFTATTMAEIMSDPLLLMGSGC